jgi:hypothetical protein
VLSIGRLEELVSLELVALNSDVDDGGGSDDS